MTVASTLLLSQVTRQATSSPIIRSTNEDTKLGNNYKNVKPLLETKEISKYAPGWCNPRKIFKE